MKNQHYSQARLKKSKYFLEIKNLEKELFGNTLYDVYKIDNEIQFILHINNGNMLGYVSYKINESNCDIYNLATKKNCTNKGIATSLLKMLQKYNIYLEVNENNSKAISLYTKNRFIVYHKVANYYQGESCLKMKRSAMITKKAAAKINLVLNVLERDVSGYHQVDFIMASLNLYDDISIEISEQDEFVCPKLEIDKELNIAYKAWMLIKKDYNIKKNVKITIDKHIPIAAGMAGGSSDAAAVICAIDELFNLQISNEQKLIYAKKLGSDVAFCLTGDLARATGHGEILEKLDYKMPKMNIIVINPNIPLSTKEVYLNHKITPKNNKINEFINANNTKEFLEAIHNDLTITAMELTNEIKKMCKYIQIKYTNKIILSGSGPTILVFEEEDEKAKEIYDYAKEVYELVYLTTFRD